MSDVSPALMLLALLASAALPIGFNFWLWQGDRRRARRLAIDTRPTQPFMVEEQVHRVSFLVPAWNDACLIDRCLGAIESVPYVNFEVIVCAGGNDGTFDKAAVHRGKRVQVMEQQPGEGKQRALGRCFAAATGGIVYLVDADCVITHETFRRCLEPIIREDEDEAVVTGGSYRPLPEQLDNPFVRWQLARQAYTAAGQPRYTRGLLGGNCVLRREALVLAGGFHPAVSSGTDYDLAKRLISTGQRIRCVSCAGMPGAFPTAPGEYARQQARWIRNVLVLGFRHREYAEALAALRTSLVGLGMLVGPLFVFGLALWKGAGNVVTLAAACLWLAAVLEALAAQVRRQRFTDVWLGLPPHSVSTPLWALIAWLMLDFVAWSLPILEWPFLVLSKRQSFDGWA